MTAKHGHFQTIIDEDFGDMDFLCFVAGVLKSAYSVLKVNLIAYRLSEEYLNVSLQSIPQNIRP